MKITNVEAIPVGIDLWVKNWAVAEGKGMIQGIGYVLVKVHTDESITGIGEIGRFFEGETLGSVLLSIREFLAPRLRGLDPTNIAHVHREMDLVLRGTSPFAKAAVEIAVYDLVGKALKVPVSTLLGGRYRDRIEICPECAGLKGVEETIVDVRRFLALGYRSIHIKLAGEPRSDIERVRAIREAIGPDVGFRVDPNGAYRTAEAIRTLRAMEEYGLMLAEQPVPPWDVEGMRQVCAALDTPILACEGAWSVPQVMTIVRQQAADAINVKIGRTGGMYGAQKMVAVAEAAGLSVTMGTMMETGLGTAAAAHFAASIDRLDYPCDLAGPNLLVDDLLASPLLYQDGYLYVPDGPGLGVELDEEKVQRYRIEM